MKIQHFKTIFLFYLYDFPSFDFILSNKPMYSSATNYKNQWLYIMAFFSFHKTAFISDIHVIHVSIFLSDLVL